MAKRIKDKKKKKSIVDPNAPKKPTCAYFFFQIIRRPQVKEERPYLTNTEVVIQLGKDWNVLTNLQKLPFEKLAEADKIRYERDLEVYRKDHPEVEELEDDEVEVETQGTVRKKKNQKRKKPKSNKDKTEKKKKKAKSNNKDNEGENHINNEGNEAKNEMEVKEKETKVKEKKEKIVKEKKPKEPKEPKEPKTKKIKEPKSAKTIDEFLNINKSISNTVVDIHQTSEAASQPNHLNDEIKEVINLVD